MPSYPLLSYCVTHKTNNQMDTVVCWANWNGWRERVWQFFFVPDLFHFISLALYIYGCHFYLCRFFAFLFSIVCHSDTMNANACKVQISNGFRAIPALSVVISYSQMATRRDEKWMGDDAFGKFSISSLVISALATYCQIVGLASYFLTLLQTMWFTIVSYEHKRMPFHPNSTDKIPLVVLFSRFLCVSGIFCCISSSSGKEWRIFCARNSRDFR